MFDQPHFVTPDGNDAPNGFQYHIRYALTLEPLPVHKLTMVGHAEDMERGALRIASPASGQVHYFPVQAIPQGVAEPDLVVDVRDGDQILITLHFCLIWRGLEQSADPKSWQRVSFSEQSQALLYNDVRLSLCSECLHLHKYPCIVGRHRTMGKTLDQALAESRMAMCVHVGCVYLVVEDSTTCKLYHYSISPSLGLQRYPTSSFSSLLSLQDDLKYRGVPLFLGWQSVEAKPPVFSTREKL